MKSAISTFYLIFLTSISVLAQIELVKDINPSGSGIGSLDKLMVYDGHLYFAAQGEAGGFELWKSDGTTSGTILLKDIYPGGVNSAPQKFTLAGDYMFFEARDNVTGRELYRTDGTTSGTVLVEDMAPGFDSAHPDKLVAVGDQLFFHAFIPGHGQQLHVVVGNSTPEKLTPGSTSSLLLDPVGFNNKLYFGSQTDADALGIELYASDGTVANTSLIKDIWVGGSNDSNPQFLTAIGDKLYFQAEDANGVEPWISDGTTSGTRLLKNLVSGDDDSNPQNFTDVNGSVFFTSEDINGTRQLWVSDGTEAGTVLVKTIETDFGSPLSNFTAGGGILYFSAEVNNNGRELWRSDGTASGTYQIRDIFPGSDDSLDEDDQWLYVNNKLYFSADNGTNGEELWISDGTEEGTVLLQDLEAGGLGSSPKSLTVFDESLYFFAYTGDDGTEFRKYTPESVQDPCEGVSCPIGQVCYGGSCYDPTLSGYVVDENGDPLADVMIQYSDASEPTYTDENGFYAFPSAIARSVRFSKDLYTPRTFPSILSGTLDVVLTFNPCEGVACPFGQVCYGGSCYDPIEQIEITLSVEDKSDNTPIAGLEVRQLGVNNSMQFTDASGQVTIQVKNTNRRLVISDPNGIYATRTITPQLDDYLLQLSKNSCNEVACPIGEVCHAGRCGVPSLSVFGGYVFDSDSLPLVSTLVTNLSDSNTYSNANGYFKLEAPIEVDTLLFNFSKTGHGSQNFMLVAGQANEIYITKEDKCYNVNCPPGQVCYDGSCYAAEDETNPDLCADVWCPIGQVCYDGSCYDPCDSTIPGSLCYDDLKEDTCDNVFCPIGEVCFNGICYDNCDTNASGDITQCYNDIADPCENINPPPGYYCSNGVVLPSCQINPSACDQPNICDVIACIPGEACFQCDDEPNTGTNLLSGTLALEGANSGGRTQSDHNNSRFVYLLEMETGKKTAIAKTDDSGHFVLTNIPEGRYQLFVTAPGYFMEEQQQLIQLGNNEEIALNITSEDRFIKVSQSRVTATLFDRIEPTASWHPVPNTGRIFYLKTSQDISNLSIYNSRGVKVNVIYELRKSGSGIDMVLDKPMTPGFYVFKWATPGNAVLQSQTIMVIR